jgi:hypothetical protein
VDRAWLDLRLRLADRIAEGLVNGRMEPLDITAATGETLSVSIADDCVVVEAGHEVHSTENVDEAAHEVFQVLHDEWQVVHPVFLDTELVEVPAVKDNDIKVAVPMLDRADSREQLHAWLEAALGSGLAARSRLPRTVRCRGLLAVAIAPLSRLAIRVESSWLACSLVG